MDAFNSCYPNFQDYWPSHPIHLPLQCITFHVIQEVPFHPFTQHVFLFDTLDCLMRAAQHIFSPKKVFHLSYMDNSHIIDHGHIKIRSSIGKISPFDQWWGQSIRAHMSPSPFPSLCPLPLSLFLIGVSLLSLENPCYPPFYLWTKESYSLLLSSPQVSSEGGSSTGISYSNLKHLMPNFHFNLMDLAVNISNIIQELP